MRPAVQQPLDIYFMKYNKAITGFESVKLNFDIKLYECSSVVIIIFIMIIIIIMMTNNKM